MSVTAILAVESSAISQVSFDYDEMQVGVTYKSNPDKSYVFSCQNPVDVLHLRMGKGDCTALPL
jgi:hypothetical protein